MLTKPQFIFTKRVLLLIVSFAGDTARTNLFRREMTHYLFSLTKKSCLQHRPICKSPLVQTEREQILRFAPFAQLSHFRRLILILILYWKNTQQMCMIKRERTSDT